jgi:hypothetical protein
MLIFFIKVKICEHCDFSFGSDAIEVCSGQGTTSFFLKVDEDFVWIKRVRQISEICYVSLSPKPLTYVTIKFYFF